MSSVLSKPKAPDTSKQQALLAEQDKALKQKEYETAQKAASSRSARRASRASLITGQEAGVIRDTLG